MGRKTAAQIVASATDAQLAPSAEALASAEALLDEAAGPSAEDIEAACKQLTAELTPDTTTIETPAPAGKEQPVMPADPKPLTKAQQKAAEKAAAATAAAETAPEASPADAPAAVLFTGGRTIAQIAVQTKMSQAKVREALDTAGIDYSKDKNNGARPAAASPSPAASSSAPDTPADKLDKMLRKYEAGSLSPRRQGFADRLKGDRELGHRLAAIGALQQDDEDKFGAALCALLSFLATDYDSNK